MGVIFYKKHFKKIFLCAKVSPYLGREKILKLFMIFIGVCYCFGASALEIIDKDIIGDVVNFNKDYVIDDKSQVNVNKIKIAKSILLTNFGSINSRIEICPDCVLYFHNRGEFSGTFDFAPGAELIHVASRRSDFDNFATDDMAGVMVTGHGDISMSDIADIGAGRLILDNASIVLDTGNLIFLDELELRGDVIMFVNEDFVMPRGVLATHVTGDGALHIVSNLPDPLMGFKTERIEDMLYINYARETDYAKILRNDAGVFLNGLRQTNPGDRLLRELDAAPDINTLHGVMADSVRLNPVRLMRTTRLTDRMETLFAPHGDMNFGAFTVLGRDFGAYGARADIFDEIFRGIKMGISGYMYAGQYSDNINDYGFMSFGGNVRAEYDDDNGRFVRGTLGVSRTRFEVGPVFDGTGSVDDPVGLNIYGALDIGMSIKLADGWNVAPYVGVLSERALVAHDADFLFTVRAGGEMIYKYSVFDIKYEFAFRAYGMGDGYLGAGATMEIKFPWDGMGIYADTDIISTEMGTMYKIGTGARMWF